MDISCQLLGEGYNFEGFCAPLRAQGLEIQFQKYYFVSNISCQQLGEEYNFEGICAPLRAQGLEIYNFKNIILYLIYHANTWGKNIVHMSVFEVLVPSTLQKYSIYGVYCSLKKVNMSVLHLYIRPPN